MGLAAGSVLLVLAVSGIGYQVVLMEADYQYLLANVGSSGAERIAAAQLAVKLNPFNDMYRAEVGMAYRQDLVDAATAEMQAQSSGQDTSQYPPIINQDFQASIAALKDTIAFVPSEYDNYVFIASVYNIGGSLLNRSYYSDAINWAQKGMQVEPYGPAVRVEYARALLATNRTQEAIKVLEDAWAMDNANADAGEMLAQQYKATGRLADAIKVLKAIQAVNGTDQNLAPMLQQYEASATTGASKPATKSTP